MLAHGEITAGWANIVFGINPVAQSDKVAAAGYILLNNDKISTFRHGCPGEDAYGLTRAQRACVSMPRRGLADDFKHRIGFNLGPSQGVTVHRRCGERGLAALRCHGVRQNTPIGGA